MTAKKLPASQGKNKEGRKDYEVGYKKPPVHSRWKPGQSGNPKGAPRKISIVSDLLNKIFEEKGPVMQEGKKVGEISRLEAMFREWIGSKEYQKQRGALEYGFGKVPDEIYQHTDIQEFIKSNLDLFTDGQIKRLRDGENGMEIIAEILREIRSQKK